MLRYTEKLTESWTRKGKRDKLSVKMDNDARYSFYRFAVEHNLLEDSRERMNELWIPCPFHEDAAPSCSLNDYLHRYHCFSCDRGGNYISFLAEYDRSVLGINISYYQKMNELLLADQEMQATINASTIYTVSDDFSLEEGLKKFVPKLHEESVPSSYPELASLMKKRHCSIEEIKYFILLMQSGWEPYEIYREIFKKETKLKSTERQYDLTSMMLDI